MSPAKRSETHHIWLRVSPMGKRCGFLSLADGTGGTLTFTIVPKMWAATVGVVRSVEHESGATTHVVAHELDFVRLTSGPQAVNAFVINLTKVTGAGEAQLLETCPPPKQRPWANASVVGSPFSDLLDLLNIANRSGARLVDDLFSGGPEQAITRVLTYERFLRTLEPLLFRARPHYLEHTDELSSPKGRLDDRSLLITQATGRPWVLSTFDDLTMDTKLLQVARAGLHTIAADRLPKGIQVLAEHVGRRAVQLARYLAQVTLLHPDHALHLAERLWLSPLERSWQAVLDAAKDVLRQYGPTPTEGADNTDAFVVHVLTEKFWEQAVTEFLGVAFGDIRASADNVPGPGINAPRPWVPHIGSSFKVGVDSTFPDYMFRTGINVVVGDAKYKLSRGIAVQDGYQLFAYSHLATLDGRLSDVAIVLYPHDPGTEPTQTAWTRNPDGNFTLWAIRLPFPSRQDLNTGDGWARYVIRTGAYLVDLSHDWNPQLAGATR